jgi:hypothetical protein
MAREGATKTREAIGSTVNAGGNATDSVGRPRARVARRCAGGVEG